MSNFPELQMQEVSCQKAINDTNFVQGLQEYVFSIGRPNAFVPSKSYFRFRLTLSGAAGGANPPTMAEALSFADNAVGNMYNNIYFRGGGQDISALVSYCPQAGQIKNRLTKSGAWTNSIGKGAYMCNPSFDDRCALTSTGNWPSYSSASKLTVGTAAATVAIANATGVLTGINTTFTTNKLAVGDTFFVLGVRYTVTVLTDEVTCTVVPIPGAAVGVTVDFYVLKSNPSATENGKNDIYVIWRPPIGIMDCEEVLGAGDYRFSLNPNADYLKSCVQSRIAKTVNAVAAANGFNVVVQDIKFYAAVVKASIPDQVQNLYLMETDVQSKALTPGSQTLQFTVPPSTKFLTVFIQTNRAGTDTTAPPSLFTTSQNQEQAWSSLQLTYANITRPSTRWDSTFGGTRNNWQQRYVDNLRECNMLDSVGGAETFAEFLERGIYVHYSFARDESDRSTQVQLSTAFTALPAFAEATKVFLCSHYTRAVELTTSNGSIVAVRTLTV